MGGGGGVLINCWCLATRGRTCAEGHASRTLFGPGLQAPPHSTPCVEASGANCGACLVRALEALVKSKPHWRRAARGRTCVGQGDGGRHTLRSPAVEYHLLTPTTPVGSWFRVKDRLFKV
eukprot:365300-Chlamydomonas_euryale.AAC.17